MIPSSLHSLLISLFFTLLIQTSTAHPLTKRKGGGGGRGGGGSGFSFSAGSMSWKVVLVIVGSILGMLLLLYIIFWQCIPGGRFYDCVKKVRDERLARKWARYEAKDANANANARPEMGVVV